MLLIPAKFATGVNNTGGKFATGINDADGNLPPVSTTPVANNGNKYQTADNSGLALKNPPKKTHPKKPTQKNPKKPPKKTH